MKRKSTEKEVKKRLPKIKKIGLRVALIEELYKKRALDNKSAIRTKELEFVHKHSGKYLKELETKKIVGILKRGSAHFLLDRAGKNKKETFLYIYPTIKEAREKRVENLLKQIDEDSKQLILAIDVLNLDSNASIIDVAGKIYLSENKETEKLRLKNYNKVVVKLKENKIGLKDFNEMKWMRGSYSWYLKEDFILECSTNQEE